MTLYCSRAQKFPLLLWLACGPIKQLIKCVIVNRNQCPGNDCSSKKQRTIDSQIHFYENLHLLLFRSLHDFYLLSWYAAFIHDPLPITPRSCAFCPIVVFPLVNDFRFNFYSCALILEGNSICKNETCNFLYLDVSLIIIKTDACFTCIFSKQI